MRILRNLPLRGRDVAMARPLPSGKPCYFAAFLHKDTHVAVSGRSAPTPGAWPLFSYFGTSPFKLVHYPISGIVVGRGLVLVS